MDKLITLSGYDPRSGPHIFAIEPDLERSIGHIKMARPLPPAVEQYIRTAKPMAGKSQLLIDALGAGEYWGDNVNGDIFYEAALRHEGQDYGYQTFMHLAYPFKHHCFPAGTAVVMADRVRRPIEDVVAGELVATLVGPRPVTKTMRRRYAGSGMSIRLRGEYEPLVGTEDHLVKVYRREQIHCRCKYNRLTPSGHEKHCVEYRKAIGDPEWVPLSSVLVGDYVVLPKPAHGSRAVAPEFARLVGWIASEGYLGKNGAIQFTFSEDNAADIAAVTRCLEENGVHAGTTPRPQYETVSVWGCSADLSSRLSEYVTGRLSEKALTGKVLEWDAESLLQMLGAYVDGDGHVPRTGKNTGQLRIRSSSPQMLRMLADVIRSLEIPATVQWDCPPGEMVSPTNGKTYENSGSGVVSVEMSCSPVITKYSRKNHVRVMEKLATKRLLGDVYIVQISEVDHIYLDEEVFNLEVEEVHHYIAGEVVVHNCNKDPARAYGDKVSLSAYDPMMHRVLLIAAVDNQKCSDILSDLSSGNYWDVSMGCRVQSDRCSICNNVAKNRGEYCPHLRYQMRKILPDGRRVCAINDKPRFFDISFVTIGAEKASHILQKVAEESQRIHEISSAEAGEQYYGKLAGAKVGSEKKLADIDKDVPNNAPAKIVPIKPELKGELANLMNDSGDVKADEAPLPTALLDSLTGFPLSDIFTTLAALGIDLRPQEFQRIVLIKLGHRNLAEKLAQRRLVFDEASSGKTPDWAQAFSRFDPERVNEKVAMQLRPYMASRSCYPEPLVARLRQMEKSADPQPGDQYYKMTDEAKRAGSGMSGLVGASLALAGGFWMFRKLFPQIAETGPLPIRLLARHPWLIPILAAAGVGATVALSGTAHQPTASPQGTGGGLDAMGGGNYDGSKTASIVGPIARFGLVPLTYLYAGVQQRRWERGEQLNGVDRFIASRPDLAAIAAFAFAPRLVQGVQSLAKMGSTMGDMAMYAMGSGTKLMPAVLAGALVDSLVFRGIQRLASRKQKGSLDADAGRAR